MSTLTRGTTRLARRSAMWSLRRALRMATVFIAGCIGGWWWDRPGLVRDKALESVFERRAQVSSSIFWPTFAVWFAARVPGCPGFLVDLALWAHLDVVPRLAWTVALSLFATLVLMRRLMAARGRGWDLRPLLRVSKWRLEDHLSLSVVLALCCVVGPTWSWLAGWQPNRIGTAIPPTALLTVGAIISWREGAWLRKTEPYRPALIQALGGGVPKAVMDKAVIRPRRRGGVVLVSPAPEVVERLDRLRDGLAIHLPHLEHRVCQNEHGAVTSVVFPPVSPEEKKRRGVLAQTDGLVGVLSPVPNPSAHRPDEHIAAWGDKVTGTMGGQVNVALEPLGFTVVEWLPDRRQACVARLDNRTVALRDGLVRELDSLRDPWDIEIDVEAKDGLVEAVTLHRSPGLGGGEKRTESWSRTIWSVMPPDAGRRWLVEDDAAGGTVVMRHLEDLLRAVRPYPWDTEDPTVEAIPFGIREDGSPLAMRLLEMNQLLGGTPGGGKSGGLTTLLCGIAQLSDVALVGLDPKRVEQRPWRTRFSRIAKTEDEATDVLARLQDEMERRYIWLEDQGLKKIGPAQMSKSMPLIVLVIDELADLVSVGSSPEGKKADGERATLIRRLIAKGRAAGIVVIAATQKPQADVVPTALRDLIQLRVAYATTNSDMTDTILGKGMALNGGESHTISANEQGVCFVVNETSRVPVRARTYWVPDEDVEEIAARYAGLRIDLPWLEPGAPEPKPFEPIPADSDTVKDLGERNVSLDELDEFDDEFEVPVKVTKKSHADLSDAFD